MNITQSNFEKKRAGYSFNRKIRNHPLSIRVYTKDDFESFKISVYVHMCNQTHNFGFVYSFDELNEKYVEVLTQVKHHTADCKNCKEYHEVLKELSSSYNGYPKIQNPVKEYDDSLGTPVNKVSMINRDYYFERLRTLEKNRKKCEEDLAYAKIKLDSIDTEISKLKEYLYKSNNPTLRVTS